MEMETLKRGFDSILKHSTKRPSTRAEEEGASNPFEKVLRRKEELESELQQQEQNVAPLPGKSGLPAQEEGPCDELAIEN